MNHFYNEDKVNIDSQLASDLVSAINKIILKRDVCNLAVAGGRSIASILDLLALQHIDWQKVHVFAVDDRCVPVYDPESNSGLIKQHLADKVAVKFHSFDYQPGQADKGAGNYTEELNKLGGRFDIVLLSSGEDGHTAGLFPNHGSFEDAQDGYIFFDNSPKDPPERVSLSRRSLLKSAAAFILFVGEGKQQAYERFLDKNVAVKDCPAKLVQNLPEAYMYTDLSTS
jgi:6-phosphogluconolactonase